MTTDKNEWGPPGEEGGSSREAEAVRDSPALMGATPTTEARFMSTETRSASQETFSTTLERLREQEASKVDLVLNTETHLCMTAVATDGAVEPRIEFRDDVPEIGGREFGILDHAHGQIAARSGVPVKFYNRLRSDHPDLLAHSINTLWAREPEQRMVRSVENGSPVVRAWLSDRYRVVDNLPFLTAALEEAERHGAIAHTAHVDDTRLYVKLLTPRHTDVAQGDPIRAGVIIRNSEVGDGRISVAPFILRLVCTNGMVAAQQYNKVHLGGALDAGVQSSETQEKESAYIFSAVQDWIRWALADENLDTIAARFRESQEVRVEAPAKLAVANVVRLGGLSRGEGSAVLERYLRADNDSQFTLVNAVTAEAKSAESYRRQVELEELGGRLLDMQTKDLLRLTSRSLSERELANALGSN